MDRLYRVSSGADVFHAMERDGRFHRALPTGRTIFDGYTPGAALPDGLGGLTLLQVIEHLEPQEALDLVPLAARKVRPGGKVIVETANPQSVYALARSFHVDPTHVRPMHPAYLEFLFREAGFAEVELVFAAQDYAVIATR